MSKTGLFVLAAAVLAQCGVAYTEAALKDQVKALPGAENLNLNFNQFSGFLDVPGASGDSKHLHYWFVESQGSPTKDPLAFWSNGGPGCSGLIGFLTEHGPFRPNADLSLSLNEYSWNTISNVVYIESPAGVGFSYSDDKADYTTGDAQTALDNYNLIQAFLTRFPEYQTNELYITSESYGGHYIPTLAKQIVDENTAAATTGNRVLNFKGFAVGNPYTNPYSGTPAMFDTFWGHQLLPKPTYDQYQKDCVKSPKPNVKECIELQVQLNTLVGNLNPYALDYPVCTTDSAAKHGRAQRTWLLNQMMNKIPAHDRKRMGVVATEEYVPCEDDYSSSYLNQASVKKAIHVEAKTKWESCSYKLKYNTTDSSEVSTAPIYNYLIDGNYGLNILVYSGDDDSVCGTVGTQAWIWDLGYTVAGKAWQTYTVADQVAGYATAWKNTKLGFLTIHGAGHEVPTYKPEVALDMWKRYLAGEFTKA